MSDVLIVGAGPTGLAHALWLTAQGIRVRIIDRTIGPGTTSRAMAVQARTLELYRQLGLSDEVVTAGFQNRAMNIWARGKRRARVALQDIGTGLSPYSYILVYPQDLHEKTLVAKLASLGVQVERQTELVDFEDKGDRIEARVRHADRTEETISAGYLAACDGASSTVRKQLGIGFEGGTYRQVFYVADVEFSGLENVGEAHIALNGSDFVAVLSYSNDGKARLIGTIQDERAERPENLTFDDVGHEAIASVGIKVDKVNWFSHYRVHHRVADRFRQGRVFLMGDAGHVHSPAGGQGMNTGILDAINLAWKLADVIRGRAPDSLLDTYATERQAFARELVKTTDRIFSLITADGSLANIMRSYGVPLIASAVYKVGPAREMLFKMVSQTALSYNESALSEGSAGDVHGGQRLPWVNVNGDDNFEPLPMIGWQIHVYGTARAEIKAWCAGHDIVLREFAWTPAHEQAGLKKDAVYLLRPDTWVALADPAASVEVLDAYFVSRSYVPCTKKRSGFVAEAEPKWSRRKDARPQEIIEAAIDEFVSKGYANAKLADVAKRAGVVKGTIYRYFETKADLFRAVARHLVTENLSVIEDVGEGPDVDAITVFPMILSHVAGKMNDARLPGIVRMVLVEGRTFPDLAAVWHDEVITRVVTFLTATIERGQREGTIREGDPALMLFSIMGPMLLGVLFRDTFTDSPFAPDIQALATQHAGVLKNGLSSDRP